MSALCLRSIRAVIGVGTIYAYTVIQEKCQSSHRCHFVKYLFFRTRLLHAHKQYVYIVLVKHWINLSKAVVGVDRPMKTPSLHIQKPYQRKIV